MRRYIYGRNLLEMTTDGSDDVYHHDALGSVATLTSDTGDKVASYLYEPFGAERPVVPPNPPTLDNRMRFTGEYFDPTGLYHLRARQYDSGSGAFLSVDPLPPSGDVSFVSAYAYANNRPVAFVDPAGLRGEHPEGWEDCPWPKVLPVVGDAYCEGFLGMSPEAQGIFGATVVAAPAALGVAVAGEACVVFIEGCATLSAKLALNGPHHTFPEKGQRWHIFFNWWHKGVDGSIIRSSGPCGGEHE
jgi:RHS repeat-associated protein